MAGLGRSILMSLVIVVVGQTGGVGSEDELLDVATPTAGRGWNVDYRVRRLFNSSTSYEFGTPLEFPDPFAPLSRLTFALDSTWHGLQLGWERRTWRLRCEWLTPMQQQIDGVMADYDWNIDEPTNDPSRLDSLTHSSLRWNTGHMLDLGGEFMLRDTLFGSRVEFWPTGGFRFQRFDITAYDLYFLVPAYGPDLSLSAVDVLTFDQRYYVGYFGGQLRRRWTVGQIPIDVQLQADMGPAAGHNIDHHLLREGERYTIQETRGIAWHLGLNLDVRLTRYVGLGLQADYAELRTTGSHRLLNEPLDMDWTWTNGVVVASDQLSLAGYLRVSF